MFYTVYKTTNQVNGKFYIGVHKTEDPNDSYIGSGKLLWRAIEKYGWANFKKEVLFSFDNPEEAFKKEEELVALALKDPLCYNLRSGGAGGFDFCNQTRTYASRFLSGQKGGSGLAKRIKEDSKFKKDSVEVGHKLQKLHRIWREKNPEKIAEVTKNATKAWTGCHHSLETKKVMSELKKGKSNGTCWVYNEQESIKISKEDLVSYLSRGWIQGRKM